jgi:hypothetical protein
MFRALHDTNKPTTAENTSTSTFIRKSEAAMAVWRAPDDGHCNTRNMLSSVCTTKQQTLQLIVASSWLFYLSRYEIIINHCVITQKSAVLIFFVAEAWNLASNTIFPPKNQLPDDSPLPHQQQQSSVSNQQKPLSTLPANICRHSFHITAVHFIPREGSSLQMTKP